MDEEDVHTYTMEYHAATGMNKLAPPGKPGKKSVMSLYINNTNICNSSFLKMYVIEVNRISLPTDKGSSVF